MSIYPSPTGSLIALDLAYNLHRYLLCFSTLTKCVCDNMSIYPSPTGSLIALDLAYNLHRYLLCFTTV